jgi:23S rRNA (cytosine1962-C5)-methyltransferase
MQTIDATVFLKAGREKPVRKKHPWIFSGAIDRVSGAIEPGDLVKVAANDGRFLAQAIYNPHSQIRARILTWEQEIEVDEAFWRTRLSAAVARRNDLDLDLGTTAYRLVNAESDGLPGLVVDRYGDFLVIQCLSAGIERRKEMIVELLVAQLQPAGIVERSDVSARKKEGLSSVKGVVWGDAPPDELIILENGLRFGVDLLRGQKTGFYLDQRVNRRTVCRPRFVAGKEMLNVFAYTGGFAANAAANDAGPIINIDSSADWLTQAERNVALNVPKREQDEYIVGDAFEVLRYFRDSGRQFDVVVLDPPKFAHSKRDVNRASRGYKDLNWLALRLLRQDGLLATFSCSGRISADLFQKILFGAAIDAGRDVQIIQQMGQAADHPILLSFPESGYLKGLLCRIW